MVTPKYWAFISYSSIDTASAKWLLRAIETYKVPPQLVNQATPAREPSPRHFRPLFHDRAELPASSDLGTAIVAALESSRYLIVLCSPNSAVSAWVNKEVEAFQALHGPDRILAVVSPETPAGDARSFFPAALRLREPLAADARRNGDAKQNAVLKLIAGMLGVGFDTLKQRESERRIRGLRVLVGAITAAMVGLASLAWYANYQRGVAVAAREQAEGVLEYLLFDMTNQLDQVGRSDMSASVQKRVEEYYKSLGLDESTMRIARNRSAALANEAQLAALKGDSVTAVRTQQQSLSIKQRLARTNPSSVDLQRDLSIGFEKLGDIYILGERDVPLALRAYTDSYSVAERMAAADPTGWRHDLSVSSGKIGDAQRLLGQWVEAAEAYRRALHLNQQLLKEAPSDQRLQREIAYEHLMIGITLKQHGSLQEAFSEYQAFLSGIRALAQVDLQNTTLQHDLGVGYDRIGELLLERGELKSAIDAYQVSLNIAQQLAARDLTNVRWQRDLWIGFQQLAIAHERARSGEAVVWWQRALAQLEGMQSRGMPILPGDEELLHQMQQRVRGPGKPASR